MKRYPIRIAKYVIYLAVLFVIIFALMNALNGTQVGLKEMFTNTRSLWLLVVVVVFALLYPFFGFTKKSLTMDAAQRAEDVQKVMHMCGYIRVDQGENDKMMFRASSGVKRLMLMYEDCITITTTDGLSVMEGPRKEVVKASFRMTTFVA